MVAETMIGTVLPMVMIIGTCEYIIWRSNHG
jgi:hypothetical protein